MVWERYEWYGRDMSGMREIRVVWERYEWYGRDMSGMGEI